MLPFAVLDAIIPKPQPQGGDEGENGAARPVRRAAFALALPGGDWPVLRHPENSGGWLNRAVCGRDEC